METGKQSFFFKKKKRRKSYCVIEEVFLNGQTHLTVETDKT